MARWLGGGALLPCDRGGGGAGGWWAVAASPRPAPPAASSQLLAPERAFLTSTHQSKKVLLPANTAPASSSLGIRG